MKKSALVIALLLSYGISAHSESIVVGVADNAGCLPFACNESGLTTGQSIEYQQIYSSSALAGLTSFNMLTFFDNWSVNNLYGGGPLIPGAYSINFYYASQALVNHLSTTLSSNEGAYLGTFANYTASSPVSFNSAGALSITGNTIDYNAAKGALLMDVVAANQADIPNWSGNGYFDVVGTGALSSTAYDVTGTTPWSASYALVTGFGNSTSSVSQVGSTPEPASFFLAFGGIAAALLFRSRLKKAAN